MKLALLSTPELLQTSNIYPAYLQGDQRKYHIPCPCCGEFIPLEWEVDIEGFKDKAGIYYQLDSAKKLIADSVGYVCQLCMGFFKENIKHELNLLGEWRPTAEASQPGYYSYHLSCLYTPAGMETWEDHVRTYLSANPPGQPQKESEQMTFVNLCLGLPYEKKGEGIKPNVLQKNIRPYDVNTVPELLSIKDGNGKILLLTCACDLNGTIDDARLDYEVLAWSESGSSYSICQGSIGTFVPREGIMKNKADRSRWTYTHGRENNVWRELDKIIYAKYNLDSGRSMRIGTTGVDTGHYTEEAYQYIDTREFVVGVKGKDAERFSRAGVDTRTFKQSIERPKNLYIVYVNMLKDELARLTQLRYDEHNDDAQPAGFMNYPTPSLGQYTYKNYFLHYEAEHREDVKDKQGNVQNVRWVKKNSNVQNHFFDVRIYGMVLRDILVWELGRSMKIQRFEWSDFVDYILKNS